MYGWRRDRGPKYKQIVTKSLTNIERSLQNVVCNGATGDPNQDTRKKGRKEGKKNQEKKTNSNDYQNIKGQGAANTIYLCATYAQAMRELCLYEAIGSCWSAGLVGSRGPKVLI